MVAKQLCSGLIQRGFEVVSLGMYDTEGKHDSIRIWPVRGDDLQGYEQVGKFLEVEGPDVLVINYDPGTVHRWVILLREIGSDIPVVAYFPIEGQPVAAGFLEMIRMVTVPITYTESGSKAIWSSGEISVPWTHHGADHAPFERLSEAQRERLKADIGWEGKFVVGYVATNKRTKQQPRLMRAVQYLREGGRRDVRLYLHTMPFQNYMMDGWNLLEVSAEMGLRSVVRFPPDITHYMRGIGYEERGRIDETLLHDSSPEAPIRMLQAILASYNMIELYNMMDVFVSVSQVEGFGLPLVEAMACGVPIVAPRDGMAQEEVVGDAGILIESIDWDVWKTGARLCNISPEKVAGEIECLMGSRELREEYSRLGLARAAGFTWSSTVSAIERSIREALVKSPRAYW